MSAHVADKTALHLTNLFADLEALRAGIVEEGEALVDQWAPWIRRADFAPAARNLACYLAMRRRDLCTLQDELTRFGLSSLGRSESRTAESLAAISALVARAAGVPAAQQPSVPSRADFVAGNQRLEEECLRVFGVPSAQRRTRIMVTLPESAADNLDFMTELLRRNVEAVRINCAHNDEKTWGAMIKCLRRAEQDSGMHARTRVLMDLGGPKLRTTRFDTSGEKHRFIAGESFWLARAPSDVPAGERAIGCSLPEVIGQLAHGDPVWIDDGEMGGRVSERRHGAVRVQITHAPSDGKRLKADKGLNFPASELAVPALTDADLAALPFVAKHADLIGYSFVQGAEDVQRLQAALESAGRRGTHAPALMMKIETRRAVRNLPEIIVAAAGRNPTAVMIARGDLAIELGYQRLAEMQEEILWLCEAASVPVVWATQVLESLAKQGQPSRSEITDAAMGVRAECVMLNKGPYILEAVDMLADVLHRMEAHQRKKTSRLRALQSWQALF
ncbi:pyruvate kinase [Niveibacterium sp. 24ML]|uniref:pyruvate kinase n=1 Tax=Niveibacterium sp. 24ML TaxID=2985512 RepID=UPI00226EC57A|nr:pyruvate kinase [Niveibacterium sp. 24ML]MCX9158301.1 pyruvate kinase [Niveibacterium sp. 24ML]